jgi:hypothetical protein
MVQSWFYFIVFSKIMIINRIIKNKNWQKVPSEDLQPLKKSVLQPKIRLLKRWIILFLKER